MDAGRNGRGSTDGAAHTGHRSNGTSGRRPLRTAERVAIDIVRDIVANGLRSGDHLPLEAAMVEQYEASRASIREALRLLEVQGLIWLKPGPGGGPVVGSVDAANLARTASLYFHFGGVTYDAVLRTQALLEPACAELAARNSERRAAIQRFLVPVRPASEAEYRRMTEDFHETIYQLAANPAVSLLTQAVTRIVTDHVIATTDPIELRDRILEEHMVLARAIAGGQAEIAGRLMADHVRVQHEFYRHHAPDRVRQLIEWR